MNISFRPELRSSQVSQYSQTQQFRLSQATSPKFSACPLCAAAVGTVAASSVASYAAGQSMNGSNVAVASGVSTIAGSALGGLIYATHLLEPINLIGSVFIGMLTSGLGTWAILNTQKTSEKSKA